MIRRGGGRRQFVRLGAAAIRRERADRLSTGDQFREEAVDRSPLAAFTKCLVHRTLRPEEYGAILHRQIFGTSSVALLSGPWRATFTSVDGSRVQL